MESVVVVGDGEYRLEVSRECECRMNIKDPVTLYSQPLQVTIRVQPAHQLLVQLEHSLVEEQQHIVVHLKVFD